MNDQEINRCIAEIKNGRVEAFGYIVKKYQQLAFNIALSIVKNTEDAEEVVQDSFVKIYRFLGQYTGESRFSSWLYKIVYNTSLTKAKTNAKILLKKGEIANEIKSEKNYEDPSGYLEDRLFKEELITEALEKLNESDRLLVTLYYYGEKTLPEISEITSWKISKCKVKLMRTRIKLAKLLKNHKSELL